MSRRFVELQDWTTGNAAAEQDIVVSNLSGNVCEIIVAAYPYNANVDALDIRSPVTPSRVKLVCDSVECVNVETQDEIKLIEYSHGYRPNEFYSGTAYRLVFGSHGTECDRTYQGAMNFSGISQANLKITFPSQVTYKVIAVQLGVTQITSSGRLQQNID